jgi:hypothetical protein
MFVSPKLAVRIVVASLAATARRKRRRMPSLMMQTFNAASRSFANGRCAIRA